jgi:hypothetical protein
VRAAITICATALLAAGVVAGCGGDSTTTVIETAPATSSTTSTTDSTTSTESTVSTTSTSTTEDGASPPADITVSEITGFTSPTGNIGCYIDKKTVRCDIEHRDWQPPKAPSSCQLDYGQGISMNAGGSPSFVCAGDTALGGGKPLAYGQSIGAGLLRCESEESGMSCTDAESGRGFTISKESYSFR